MKNDKGLDSNKINPDSMGQIEEISNKWDEHYSTEFISNYKRGEMTEEDVLKVAKKVAEYKKDNNLIELTKSRMGLKKEDIELTEK